MARYPLRDPWEEIPEYDPAAEIICQLEECQENIIQAIRRSTRREEFAPFMEVLLAVKRAQATARER